MQSKPTSHVPCLESDPLGPVGNDSEDMRWERGSILTAPPFGYSPELPLRRPGGPKARPARSASSCSLPSGIARSLLRLRGLHLRLSLCRVTLAPGCDGRLAAIDDCSLIAELAEDGALIVIYIHPKGIDDDEAAVGVCARLKQCLHRIGVPQGALRIAIMHCDAASIDGSDAALQMVMDLPTRPLLSPVGTVAAAAS